MLNRKQESNVYSSIITILKEEKEVIILDYVEGFFQVCQGTLCGYMNGIWINRNSATSKFIKSKETEREPASRLMSKSSYYSSSSKSTKSKNTYRKTKRYRSYNRGPIGGFYFINSNGNKTYVARSLCN